MRARISFTNMILITAIIISGAIISIAVSLTDTKAFSDKPDEKQIKETDNEMLINYQQMYKQYDFAKYLNYYYTYTNKEYTENDDSNNGVENSEINPFAAATFDNKFNEKDDNTKKQQEQQSNRGNEDDEKKYSSDKNDNDNKQYKNIKIIECDYPPAGTRRSSTASPYGPAGTSHRRGSPSRDVITGSLTFAHHTRMLIARLPEDDRDDVG